MPVFWNVNEASGIVLKPKPATLIVAELFTMMPFGFRMNTLPFD